MNRLLVAGVVTTFLLVALGIAANYLLTLAILRNSQQAWCPALQQLTATAPPASSPPRVITFYRELAGVKDRFGCPP